MKIIKLIVAFFLFSNCIQKIDDRQNNSPERKIILSSEALKVKITFFQIVEYNNSNEIRPDTMHIQLGSDKILITPKGKAYKDGKLFFNIVPEDQITELFIYQIENDIIVLYVYSDGESCGSTAKRISLNQNRIIWSTHIYALNLARPAVKDNSVYISTLGFIGKLDLVNGKFIWKHEDLFVKGNYESFNEPEFMNDSLVLFTNRVPEMIIDSIIINDKNGKIIKMN